MTLSVIAIRDKGISFLDLCWIRSVMFLVGAWFLMLFYAKSPSDITRDEYWQMFTQGINGNLGYLTQTWAIKYLPLSIWTLIINLSPFTCAILGYFILGERVSRFQQFCIAISFAGVAVVASQQEDDAKHQERVWIMSGIVFGSLLAVGDSISFGITMVVNRYF